MGVYDYSAEKADAKRKIVEILEFRHFAKHKYVQKKFGHDYGNYKTMIGYVNAEVDSYSNSLTNSALQLLEERKKKADSFSAISDALQIPLNASKNALNTKPISLKRVIRQPSAKPTIHPVPTESYISDEDYENINNIISMCSTTMEKTART